MFSFQTIALNDNGVNTVLQIQKTDPVVDRKELWLRPCSHISKVWSSSHMLLNWFIVELYQMPLILLNGPFFIRECEPQISKCANVNVFLYIYGSIYMHIDLFICISQHFKLIRLNQLSNFDCTFDRHFLWWFWCCLKLYIGPSGPIWHSKHIEISMLSVRSEDSKGTFLEANNLPAFSCLPPSA